MYDINLSFFKSKEIQSSISELQNHYDLCYKNNIANSLYKFSNCDDCAESFDLSSNADLIEISCSALSGQYICEIGDEFKGRLFKNDYVVISIDDSLEMALVKEVGDIVKLKSRKLKCETNKKIPLIVRKADEEDLKHLNDNIIEENKARQTFKNKTQKHLLEMKLVDVHYQFDRKRLYFFYTADGRVDFRELAKDLASVFKTRIELRQIGVRDETKRLGGIGSCGREYCCSSFLNNFKKITAQYASEANSASSLAKLSGPCGKLKCCLSFELDHN